MLGGSLSPRAGAADPIVAAVATVAVTVIRPPLRSGWHLQKEQHKQKTETSMELDSIGVARQVAKHSIKAQACS